jgi:hypothetical protein
MTERAEKETRGAWIVHHGRKISLVREEASIFLSETTSHAPVNINDAAELVGERWKSYSMSARPKGSKGFDLEEMLRAYFLRAGFFVARGVPLQHAGDDLTDVDLWLYERPTGSSRRRQIVDAKSKSKPKAIERLLWTKGLMELLEVDGAYVATTDSRPMLRRIAKKLGTALLDGGDLRRIGESDKVVYPDRLTEEEFVSQIAKFDLTRRDRTVQTFYSDTKSSLIDAFGTATVNRALDTMGAVMLLAASVHPNSEDAQLAVRIAYFVASIVALSIDFVISEFSFRTVDERRTALVNTIRYGTSDEVSGRERIVLATELLKKYGPKGEATGRAVETAVMRDLQNIPAEIISDYVVKHTRQDDLFRIAKRLEHAAFSRDLPSFDILDAEERSFIAALLDFGGVDRTRFANSWISKGREVAVDAAANNGPLFSVSPPNDVEKS